MIRARRFAVSRPMYAFNPTTFRDGPGGADHRYGGCREVDAVWFRRKNGRTLAATGTYTLSLGWGRNGDRLEGPPEDTYEAWVAAHGDNRYGGDHLASWDGEALLCTPPAVTPELAARRVKFLAAMFTAYPAIPAGYDGWWTVDRGAGSR